MKIIMFCITIVTMKNEQKNLFIFIFSMLVFGTIGLFRRNINLPSSFIACCRGIVGAVFLFLYAAVRHKKIAWNQLKKHMILLIISGIAMGFNWIFLFEAYRYTTVAIATLCYYMEPIILILASPLVLHEKLTAKRVSAVIIAVAGMVLVSGVIGNSSLTAESFKGIVFGLIAAVLYATVVLINKKIPDTNSYDRTMMQLFLAGVTLIPYVLLTENTASLHADTRSMILLAVVCLVHTGLAYVLFFGSMDHLPAHTIAVLGYIDPVTATLLSALLLKEPMNIWQVIGAVMILLAAAFCG